MPSEATELLHAISKGDRSRADRLLELVYDDFRRLARSYLKDPDPRVALRPTEVVHEAYLRLIQQDEVDWRGRSHFFAVGATAMRQILVDHARQHGTAKRGGKRRRVAIDQEITISPRVEEDVLNVHELIERLAKISSERAKLVELRFFGGLSVVETAEVLGVSVRTLETQWAATRIWLRREMGRISR